MAGMAAALFDEHDARAFCAFWCTMLVLRAYPAYLHDDRRRADGLRSAIGYGGGRLSPMMWVALAANLCLVATGGAALPLFTLATGATAVHQFNSMQSGITQSYLLAFQGNLCLAAAGAAAIAQGKGAAAAVTAAAPTIVECYALLMFFTAFGKVRSRASAGPAADAVPPRSGSLTPAARGPTAQPALLRRQGVRGHRARDGHGRELRRRRAARPRDRGAPAARGARRARPDGRALLRHGGRGRGRRGARVRAAVRARGRAHAAGHHVLDARDVRHHRVRLLDRRRRRLPHLWDGQQPRRPRALARTAADRRPGAVRAPGPAAAAGPRRPTVAGRGGAPAPPAAARGARRVPPLLPRVLPGLLRGDRPGAARAAGHRHAGARGGLGHAAGGARPRGRRAGARGVRVRARDQRRERPRALPRDPDRRQLRGALLQPDCGARRAGRLDALPAAAGAAPAARAAPPDDDRPRDGARGAERADDRAQAGVRAGGALRHLRGAREARGLGARGAVPLVRAGLAVHLHERAGPAAGHLGGGRAHRDAVRYDRPSRVPGPFEHRVSGSDRALAERKPSRDSSCE